MEDQKVILYKNRDGEIELEVQLDKETVWLNAHQIAKLFDVQRPAIVKHIQNIYETKELTQDSTCSILEQVAKDGKKRKMNYYNLDMIISTGYRVNSKKATLFRIWATNVLRKYLIDGYALNQNRLEQDQAKFNELKKQLKTLRNVIENETFTLDQSKELVKIITDYSESLTLLDKFDHNEIDPPTNTAHRDYVEINYDDAIKEINTLRLALLASNLFGNEKDNGFKSSLKTIFQTFDGNDLYPSIQEKAANLLYFIVKNHSFTDGNKRIGAFMFIRFLDLNGLLYMQGGNKLVSQNALVAIALLIAQSDPKDKELMTNLVMQLISTPS